MPTDVVSVHDLMSTNDFWTQVFKKFKTTLSMSYMNHHQFDGQTEQLNHEDMLRAYVSTKPTKWEANTRYD